MACVGQLSRRQRQQCTRRLAWNPGGPRLASWGVFDCHFKLSGSDPQPGEDGGHLPSSNVFGLQANSAFWARANVALNIELGGRLPLLNRFKAVPAVPLAANSCFAPSALVPPGPAVAEGDEFDGRPLGSFGLHGQRFYEFQFAL